jgi:hypothetical protein
VSSFRQKDDLGFGRMALQAALGSRGIEEHVPRAYNRQQWHVKPPQSVVGEHWELHAALSKMFVDEGYEVHKCPYWRRRIGRWAP